MKDASDSISSLSKYPSLKQLYIELNSTLPASAAVERLFSLGGKVFSPLRTRMTSEHFEMLVFMRSGKF
jgi:hAT family C-terminal dimerisation region